MEMLVPAIVQVIAGILGGQAIGAAFQQGAMSQLPRSSAVRWAAWPADRFSAVFSVARLALIRLRAAPWRHSGQYHWRCWRRRDLDGHRRRSDERNAQ